jgi:hypothetical protein
MSKDTDTNALKPFVSVTCGGEYCRCGEPAVRKVGEEIPCDDPCPRRHNLTAYVCARHYAELMGPLGGEHVGYTRPEQQNTDINAVTPEMIEAGRETGCGLSAEWLEHIYDAMSSASTKAPSPVAGDVAQKLAERFWRIHPKELQDMGLTREQFYAREIQAALEAAPVTSAVRDRLAAWPNDAWDQDFRDFIDNEVLPALSDQPAGKLVEALIRAKRVIYTLVRWAEANKDTANPEISKALDEHRALLVNIDEALASIDKSNPTTNSTKGK